MGWPDGHLDQFWRAYPVSTSQLCQDLFVLSELDFKTGGYFVEFGATDGIGLSNTYLMEKEFGWTGILAEPARRWHSDLKRNRHCSVETDCVWRESNSVLTFRETDTGEFSTIEEYSGLDLHADTRKKARTYSVNTISLQDLLDKHHAPKKIDYLSIDTEGSEYDILENFDFSKYQFQVITCEHNYGPQRDKIFALLKAKGYVRKLDGLSQFDDWYIKAKLGL